MHRVRQVVLAALASMAAHASTVLAQGVVFSGDCILPRTPPGVIIDRPPITNCRPGAAAIVRTRSDVRVELVDQVLRYEVEERFVNRGGTVGEADYMFPLPNGAAFQDLRLSIDGELVAGETLDADEARRIYEEIVRRQRDPALVEWMGRGLLRTRIFPIAPGEEKIVVIRFQSAALREGDALRVDWFGGTAPAPNRPMPMPMPVRGEAPRETDNGRVGLTLAYPNAAIYGRAYSPTHELDLQESGAERRVTVRGDARNVTVLIPVRRGVDPAISALAHAPGSDDGFVLITVAPPAGAERQSDATPRDVTLVLDVSGSMQGTKMTQARAAARQVLETLSPRDRFRLIDFATDVNSFPERTRSSPADYLPATAANLRAAREYIEGLHASGSTNIGDALRLAYSPAVDPERLSLILFVTDGEPTVGERNPAVLAEMVRPSGNRSGERASRRIFTFGVGADLNVSLLEQLAIDGGGTSHFVRPDESVERAVALVASRLVDPLLTDVRVRVEGSGIRLSRMLPPNGVDLFAGQDLVLLARYSGDGRARVVVEGSRRGVPVRWSQDVTFPERDRGNPFVARLWATQRVGYLAAERRRVGASAELDREIRDLGERYGIPTPFTSYFVQEPGMQLQTSTRQSMDGRAGRGGGGATGNVVAANVGPPVSRPASATVGGVAFEAARAASDQRATTSLGGASISTAVPGVKAVGARTFTLRDTIWTDNGYKADMRTVGVRPYSTAWFELSARIPELAAVFALGDQVIVAGRSVVIAVSSTGAETLSATQLQSLIRDW